MPGTLPRGTSDGIPVQFSLALTHRCTIRNNSFVCVSTHLKESYFSVPVNLRSGPDCVAYFYKLIYSRTLYYQTN